MQCLRILVIALSLLSSALANDPHHLQVTTRDAATGHPLSAAQVKVTARQEITRADESIQLAPLSSALELTAGRSDSQGICKLIIPSAPSVGWVALECQTEGYLGQIIALAKVAIDSTNYFQFDLIPEAGSSLDTMKLEEQRVMRRLQLWMENPDTDQRESPPRPAEGRGRLQSDSSPRGSIVSPYPVPEQVYVKDLAGVNYTGWMDLDELVAGTVTAEMNDGFPFEALKAQAVAARTYSLDRLRRRGQANGGQAYSARIGAKSLNATRNTTSIVLLYEGMPITAYYSARCNGDFTLNSEEGVTLSDCRVGALGAGVVPWARTRPCSGHVNCAATAELCCTVTVRGKINHIYGHGVGLCQRGAQELAGRDGWGWSAILTNYYTDVVIANGWGLTAGHSVTTTSRVNLRSSACGSSILATVPTNTAGVIISGPVRPACSLAAPYAHLTWWEMALPNGQRGWMAEDYLRWQPASALVLRLDWRRLDGQLVLSWPSNSLDLVLQQTPRLGPAAIWSTPNLPVSFSHGVFQVKPETTNGSQFYRLRAGP